MENKYCSLGCLPEGESRRYDEVFWKEMGKGKRSSEEIAKELGF